jgi:hypothetical protein
MKYTLWCVIAFCFGVFISYIFNNFQFFDVSLKLDVVPVFISILTLLLGIYIALVIQKNVSDKRVEKNILIERLIELKLIYNKIETETITLKDQSSIIGLFTSASKLISRLEKITKISCGKKHINDLIEIRKKHFEYKIISTGGKVQENKYLYDGQVIISLSNKYEDLVFEIDSLMISFNKA